MMRSDSACLRPAPRRPVFALALALALLWPGLAAGQESAHPADAAWDRGDYVAAERHYHERLAADSADARALHRMALILAWGEHYDHSLEFFDRLLELRPHDADAAVDRARVLAWRHDHRGAIAAVDAVLARHPGHVGALRARAQFQGWAGDYRAALDSYNRILAIEPFDTAMRHRQAQVLSWTARYDDAAHAYRDVLALDPWDEEARIGLARVLSWGGYYDEAAAVYRVVMQRDPGNLEAIRGMARVRSWSGDLRGGEDWWRRALERDPGDVESLVGLSQTLRWQGRHAEAREVQRTAARLRSDDPDLVTEMRWTRAALAPRFSPSYVLEADSDGNRVTTSALAMGMHVTPRIDLRGDVYRRELGQRHVPGLDRSTWGGQARVTIRTAPGWTLSGAAGAGVAGPEDDAISTYRFAVHSPPRGVQLGLDYGRRLLDVTAQLAGTGVTVEELAGEVRIGSVRGWALDVRTSNAYFEGEDRNRRRYTRAELGHPLGRDWRVSGVFTGFAFRDEATEGYFSPKFYGLAELNTRWSREAGSWILSLETAPGMQQVGSYGPIRGAFRAFGRVAYAIAPGRQIGIGAGYASNGLQSLAAGDSDYRYRALVVSGGWAF